MWSVQVFRARTANIPFSELWHVTSCTEFRHGTRQFMSAAGCLFGSKDWPSLEELECFDEPVRQPVACTDAQQDIHPGVLAYCHNWFNTHQPSVSESLLQGH